MPGQTITFTLSASNHGPEVLDGFAIRSSPIRDQLGLSGVWTDCRDMILSVSDNSDGTFHYYLTWYIDSVDTPGVLPLAVGETRRCQLRMPLLAAAPPVTPFSFGLSTYWSDLDPGNNSATVFLRRGSKAAAVPATSALVLAILAVVLAVVVGALLRCGRAHAQVSAHRRSRLW